MENKITTGIVDTKSWLGICMVAFSAWMVLYFPVYYALSGVAWVRAENAHGPLLLLVVFGAVASRLTGLWQGSERQVYYKEHVDVSALVLGGGAVLVAGMMLFVGRVEDVELLATASQMPMLVGFSLLFGGVRLLQKMWFPVLMMIYVVVWPGWLIDQMTAPLKFWISSLNADILSGFGIPVAHSGVILAVGPYQLLIADACAGLNSLISLTAIGAVYLYVVRRKSKWHNIFVFLSAFPLAIFANLIRVLLLSLITWWWGYDAGQGFLHMLAGFVMFAVALGGVFAVDAILAWGHWPLKRKTLKGCAV